MDLFQERDHVSFSTPTRAKVVFKLLDHGDPTTPIAENLQENNDEKEKEKRILNRVRKSVVVNSPDSANKSPGSEKTKSPGSGSCKNLTPLRSKIAHLTEAQKADHFNFCLKLSSENKITTQNAFALHLIDYFADVVKKTKGNINFQMASITLYASTKIYAVRVDCLHSDTLKMATDLHIEKRRTKAHRKSGEEEKSSVPETGVKTTKGKKHKKGKRYLLPGAEKSLDFGTIDIIEEPHEKFHALSEVFDETKDNTLLVACNLNSKNKILLCEAYPFFHGVKNTKNKECMNVQMEKDTVCDVSKGTVATITGILSSVTKIKPKECLRKTGSYHVTEEECSSMFGINTSSMIMGDSKECEDLMRKWIANDSSYTRPGVPEELSLENVYMEMVNLSNDQYSGVFIPGKSSAFLYDEGNDYMECSMIMKPRLTPTVGSPKLINKGLKSCTPGRGGSALSLKKVRMSGSAVKSFRNSSLCPPSPFLRGTPFEKGTVKSVIKPLFETGVDPVINATLTGCTRIKKKAKTAQTPRKPRFRKRRVTFDADLSDFKKKFDLLKKSCILDATRRHWSVSAYVLSAEAFNRTKESFLSTYFAGVLDIKTPLSLNDLTSKMTSLSLGEDETYYTAENADFDVELVELVSVEPEGDNGETDENEAPKCETKELSCDFVLQAFSELNLVPKPQMIKKEGIAYSKFSKHIDQKEVKAAVWETIYDYYFPEQEETPTTENDSGDSESLPERFKRLSFAQCPSLKISEMYPSLFGYLSHYLQERMSLPIAFSSLLQLANDKNLELTNTEDGDIIIELENNH